jgi:hypothetical protein
MSSTPIDFFNAPGRTFRHIRLPQCTTQDVISAIFGFAVNHVKLYNGDIIPFDKFATWTDFPDDCNHIAIVLP